MSGATPKLNTREYASRLEVYHPKIIHELRFDIHDIEILKQVQNGLIEDSKAWRLNLEAQAIGLMSRFERLLCLPLVRNLCKYDFQIQTATKVMKELRGRAILADEVGLGKTIEAGLITKELILRGLVRKVLILVPASLTEQWRDEMQEKFRLSFRISNQVEDWECYDRLISSLDTAKRMRHWERIERLTYDLVIVDEAHKLKNRATRNWKFVNSLRKKYILLLTATPIQNDLEELFNLVTLLKPGQMGTWSSFKNKFIVGRDNRIPKDVNNLRNLLFEVMIRNRRGNVLTLPPRRAHLTSVTLSFKERELYDGVTKLIRSRYPKLNRKEASVNRLALMVLQKEVGSSSYAAATTLRRLSQSNQFGYEDREEFLKLSKLADSIESQEKSVKLLEFINKFDDKVLVFTQYIQTLRFLDRYLSDYGVSHSIFYGGMNLVEKEKNVNSFKNKNRVFLSTEAGGEGRNLQFANKLINYDLPWNPLRLEQRIGRIHRVGQERDVHILSFWTENTIDEYILELLDKKINMFEMVVGELDLVLGNLKEKRSFEEVLMNIWTLEHENERFQALKQFGIELVEAKKQYNIVNNYQHQLFGDIFSVEEDS